VPDIYAPLGAAWKVGGVALVVLDPALASIVPERVGRKYRLTTA
jgi:hypothetical protein